MPYSKRVPFFRILTIIPYSTDWEVNQIRRIDFLRNVRKNCLERDPCLPLYISFAFPHSIGEVRHPTTNIVHFWNWVIAQQWGYYLADSTTDIGNCLPENNNAASAGNLDALGLWCHDASQKVKQSVCRDKRKLVITLG